MDYKNVNQSINQSINLSISKLIDQSINLRFRIIIFEFNLYGIYEAGLLLSVCFSNTELTVYCNNFRDIRYAEKQVLTSEYFLSMN